MRDSFLSLKAYNLRSIQVCINLDFQCMDSARTVLVLTRQFVDIQVVYVGRGPGKL